ncbi:28S ribosomal protein S18c, mitochondrial-like isoform X3 [Bos indicus x Bos taurus]|uniref:28S ribosomal protein S18c, mitochondrial-like isoform X3 n=2 Tax=Bos TaxID=9903 RepID=UPI000F7D5695|nr:28S ribosomal protein S18c, mitochondrial-like isoform X3 [Bos indicus x Bos taurus]
MAAMVALCSGLGKRKLTRFTTAVVCLINPGIHAVLWRSCSQYKQVTSNRDLVFVGTNKKKSQKQLRELKFRGLCQLHTRILPISKTLKFVTSNIGSKLYKVIINKRNLQQEKSYVGISMVVQ